MDKQNVLTELNFGQRIAEEEVEALTEYFVETDHWRRLFSGDVDIIYHPPNMCMFRSHEKKNVIPN